MLVILFVVIRVDDSDWTTGNTEKGKIKTKQKKKTVRLIPLDNMTTPDHEMYMQLS